MNTEVVEKDVEGWLKDVNQLLKEVQALENKVQGNLRFCNDWCPDWIRQYKLCKEAIQNVVQELQNKGNFSKVAHRAPTPGIEIFSSRKLAFQQIMEALHDDSNKRIGLHGIGGVGKTTLVKEVYKKVKELNIFEDIVMIVVSQTPDVRRIQGEIEDCLQLNLEEKSDTAKANRICLRIKSVEKILIILDDVWKDVNLGAIGIPSCDDHRGCKMLLTTRSVHVCNLMRCQRKIPLNFLVEEESLALMKKTAIVDDCPDLNDVALEVVKKCKGFPIAIITVGKALIGKSLNDWNVAMHQLRRSRLVDIEEDYNIPIEELTRYAMGLEEDEDFRPLDEARIKVRGAIDSLKDSSLLLEGFDKEFVKMHDVVRDIGLWITSKGENEFELRACTRLEGNTNLERATAISLIDYNTEQLPDNLIPPNVIRRLSQLEELIIKGGFKNWDVEGTTSEISNANLSELNSLPRLVILSLKLNSNHLPKGFVFLDLHRYFISINCPLPTYVTPHDSGSLRCISSRTLEIKDLKASSMNALKSLFRTVEYIWIESCEMECIVDTIGGNHIVTSGNLVKLYMKEMSYLRTICEGPNENEIFSNLTVLDARGCPRLISLFSPSLAQSLKKLKQLYIIGCDEMKQIISEEEMILESHGQPICLSKLETLEVMDCSKLEYIFPISVARGLQQLEMLKLHNLPRLKKVFGQNREGEGEVGDCEIESHHQPTGFPKLKTIEVKVVNCENLEYIFPISIARDLPQLESLELQNLPQLKQVFGHEEGGDDGDGNNSVLSKLRKLRLENLSELVNLGGGNSSSVWPSLERLSMVNGQNGQLALKS
uniref:AAA+ ATPase domain-containing protein n=1 Tax=Quercus lobata TaxID=97700 RepID=A0A7N2MB79_QUELO